MPGLILASRKVLQRGIQGTAYAIPDQVTRNTIPDCRLQSAILTDSPVAVGQSMTLRYLFSPGFVPAGSGLPRFWRIRIMPANSTVTCGPTQNTIIPFPLGYRWKLETTDTINGNTYVMTADSGAPPPGLTKNGLTVGTTVTIGTYDANGPNLVQANAQQVLPSGNIVRSVLLTEFIPPPTTLLATRVRQINELAQPLGVFSNTFATITFTNNTSAPIPVGTQIADFETSLQAPPPASVNALQLIGPQ